MPTFLTNSKMSPALAARIEASVGGRRRMPRRTGFAPRLVSVVRLAAIVAVLAMVGSIAFYQRRDRQELEASRAALLEAVRAESASLTADDKGSLARAASWLARFSGGAYEGDWAADELRAPGALAAILARPAVYVRGPVGAFGNSGAIAETASASSKDTLLLCLVEPPTSRAEKVLLAKVRVAYAGGAPVEQPTAHVRRLHEAEAGVPLLLPPWAARVQAAGDLNEIARLRKELEKAPIARAKQAAKAGLLLLAMDEPGTAGGVTELDGERAHDVRIGLVDLAAGKVLLRMRKHVDPSWISQQRRSEYASGLDGCALAFDVHEAVRASAASRL